MITAKIVKDSCNNFGNRITTMELVFPRIILAEAKTHRIISGLEEQVEVTQSLGLNDEILFSRNSASSRAIPFNKMVKEVKENPFIPIAWAKSHSGMQGTEYFTDEKDISWFRMNHLKARDQAIERATDAHERGLSKQITNRYLEPFMWHKVLVTFTEIDNFFNLRLPVYDFGFNDGRTFKSIKEYEKSQTNEVLDWTGACGDFAYNLVFNKGQSEIHMMCLAEAMYDALMESTPKLLKEGQYHIPYEEQIKEQIKNELYNVNTHLSPNGNYIINYSQEDIMKISVVYAAWVSYTTVGNGEKEFNYENIIRLYDKLLKSNHFSCFEHIAKCMSEEEYVSFSKTIHSTKKTIKDKSAGLRQNECLVDNFIINREEQYGWCANFRSWIQYRHLIENKNE